MPYPQAPNWTQIKNETVKDANTATRVGTAGEDTAAQIKYLAHQEIASLTSVSAEINLVPAVDTVNKWNSLIQTISPAVQHLTINVSAVSQLPPPFILLENLPTRPFESLKIFVGVTDLTKIFSSTKTDVTRFRKLEFEFSNVNYTPQYNRGFKASHLKVTGTSRFICFAEADSFEGEGVETIVTLVPPSVFESYAGTLNATSVYTSVQMPSILCHFTYGALPKLVSQNDRVYYPLGGSGSITVRGYWNGVTSETLQPLGTIGISPVSGSGSAVTATVSAFLEVGVNWISTCPASLSVTSIGGAVGIRPIVAQGSQGATGFGLSTTDSVSNTTPFKNTLAVSQGELINDVLGFAAPLGVMVNFETSAFAHSEAIGIITGADLTFSDSSAKTPVRILSHNKFSLGGTVNRHLRYSGEIEFYSSLAIAMSQDLARVDITALAEPKGNVEITCNTYTITGNTTNTAIGARACTIRAVKDLDLGGYAPLSNCYVLNDFNRWRYLILTQPQKVLGSISYQQPISYMQPEYKTKQILHMAGRLAKVPYSSTTAAALTAAYIVNVVDPTLSKLVTTNIPLYKAGNSSIGNTVASSSSDYGIAYITPLIFPGISFYGQTSGRNLLFTADRSRTETLNDGDILAASLELSDRGVYVNHECLVFNIATNLTQYNMIFNFPACPAKSVNMGGATCVRVSPNGFVSEV